MPEPQGAVALFEVTRKRFNRHDRGILFGMALFWGFAGPAILLVLGPLFTGTLIEPGVAFLAIFIVAIAASLYLIALRYNRFGVYDTGIAPTKRRVSIALRLRGGHRIRFPI